MLNLSFYITLLLLTLNQLVSMSKSGGLNIYLFDIAVGAFSFFGLLYFLLVNRSFKVPKYSILFLIFCLLALASLVLALPNLSDSELFTSAFYLFRLVSYLLAGLVVFNMIDKKLIGWENIFYAFMYSGVLLSLLGFIQLLILPDFTTLDSSLGWDPHKNRLASTFFDPNFVGAYFTMCLILLLEKFYPAKKHGGLLENLKIDNKNKIKRKYFIIFLIILLGLFLTFSRSAWGMFALAVLIYGAFRSRILLFGAFFVAFMAYFAVPRIQTRISGITDPADSTSLRLVSWGNTVKIIKDNFCFGTGFNTFRYAQRDYGFLTPGNEEIHSGAGSDSSLLFVFATTGVLGFLIYVSAMFFPVFDSYLKKRESLLIFFTIVVGFLMESQFINSLFYPQIMFLFYSVLFSYPLRT